MEVILKENINKLGKAGDLVKVKDGYARNYLIPKGLVLEASPANLKTVDLQRRRQAQREEEALKIIQEQAEKLRSVSCTISMPAGDDDKLFGSVTHADIAQALKQEGVVVDKKDIVLEEEIHRLGIYYFKVKLSQDVSESIKLWVVKE